MQRLICEMQGFTQNVGSGSGVIVVVSTIIFGASDAFGVRLRCAKTMWGYGRRDPCGQTAPTNHRYGKKPYEASGKKIT